MNGAALTEHARGAADSHPAAEPELPVHPDHALINVLPLGVALCRDGGLLHANRAFLYAFGFSSIDTLREAGGLKRLFPKPLDVARLRTVLAPETTEARSASGRRIAVPLLVRPAPGEEGVDLLMLSSVSAPRYGSDGEIASAAPEQETERRPAQPGPVDAIERDRLDFLAKVSHEVRTPLNSIVGFADLMLGERFGPVGSERYRSYLENIQSSGHYALRLVNDLLDISKIRAGAFQIDFTSVDPRETVVDVAQTMRPFVRRAKVVLRVSVAEDAPKILADAVRLKQVLLNLVTNAIKFTSEHGQVVISVTRRQDGALRIRVRDNGVGMSAPDIELAMQPFRQLDTAPRIETGTGLGLPLTKALVEAMRAKFVLESIPGEGTSVDIIFDVDRTVAEM